MDDQFEDIALKILVTGGGTGGHLFPAIALMEELKSRQDEIGRIEFLFVGTRRGIESRILQNSEYNFKPIWIRGFQRGSTVKDFLVNLLFPVRLIISLFQSIIIIKQFQPDFAIGTGGYTVGPPLKITSLMKIPFFIHEQNVFPGATTKMLARHAKKIYVSFQETKKHFENAEYYGMPLRRSLKKIEKDQALRYFELEPGKKTILIFGGSQGSQAINNHLAEHLVEYMEKDNFQVLWQTGQSSYDELKSSFAHIPSVHITPFIHEMGIAYSAADIVVCRAGALTLAELCLYGKPSVLIPLPTAAGNHQEINARILEKNGASVVVLQSDLKMLILGEIIQSILRDNNRLKEMSERALSLSKPDSAKLIINDILDYVEKNL